MKWKYDWIAMKLILVKTLNMTPTLWVMTWLVWKIHHIPHICDVLDPLWSRKLVFLAMCCEWIYSAFLCGLAISLAFTCLMIWSTNWIWYSRIIYPLFALDGKNKFSCIHMFNDLKANLVGYSGSIYFLCIWLGWFNLFKGLSCMPIYISVISCVMSSWQRN